MIFQDKTTEPGQTRELEIDSLKFNGSYQITMSNIFKIPDLNIHTIIHLDDEQIKQLANEINRLEKQNNGN